MPEGDSLEKAAACRCRRYGPERIRRVDFRCPSGDCRRPSGVSGNWTLVFDDEFDGTAIDTSAWDPHDGWTSQNNVTDHASK